MKAIADRDEDILAAVVSRRSLYIDGAGGTPLAIDLWHADPDRPRPVIFVATQYGRRRTRDARETSMFEQVRVLRELGRNGYTVAIMDVRGTGASFGTKNGYDIPSSPQFSEDLRLALEWLGTQPFSTGLVGMYGYSFVAGTQYAAAMIGSPYLRCIAPQQAVASSFRGFMNIGGIQNISFRERVDALMRRINIDDPASPVDADTDGSLLSAAIEEHRLMQPSAPALRARRFADDDLPGQPGGRFYELDHGWPRVAQSDLAIMHIGSWRDLYPDETIKLYETLKDTNPSWLVMGDWTHGEQERQATPGLDFDRLLIDFYDHHLKPGIAGPPPARVTYKVMGQNGGWHRANDWPPPVKQYRFHIDSARLTRAEPAPCDLSFTPDPDVSTTGLATRYTNDYGDEDYHRLEERAACYTSPPLASGLTITGFPELTLVIGSGGADLDLYAYLQRVDGDGRALAVTEGMLRLSNRAEGASTYARAGTVHHPTLRAGQEPMPGGEAMVTVRISLLPVAMRLERGTRLRLALFCADMGNWDSVVPADARLTIRVGSGSFLDLPVV